MRQRPLLRVTAAGGPVEIALPENPTTGYRWHLDHDPSEAVVLGTTYAPQSDQQGLAGGGGTRIFQVEVLGGSSITLDFFLRRSPDSDPLEHQPVELTP
ncbi:protease inhibitor I42 family protein [Kribbella sp. NPDC051620]|uniref:protease inhibitor I42 family protein n=1 Tax=Kribbella sp. NPDC051620 TaxID=3364120 RepID=UPI00378B7B60